MAGNHFRRILGTYKNQLSGHLTKHREVIERKQTFSQPLFVSRFNLVRKYVDRLSVGSHSIGSGSPTSSSKFSQDRERPKNEKTSKRAIGLFLLFPMVRHHNQHSLFIQFATTLLGKLTEEMQRNGEDIHKSHQKYRDLVKNTSFTETTDFDRIRNYVLKMDIKSSDKPQLKTPLCQSDLIINFPSVGATELEAHLLTTLSFLVLLSIPKEDRVTAIRPRKESDTLKKPFKTKAIGKNVADKKEEAAGKEFEPKKPSTTITRSALDKGTRPKSSICNKADYSRPYLNQRTYPAEQQTNVRSHWQEPPNEQVATKRKPAQVAFQENYQVPAPLTIPSLMSLQNNKKAFLALAVNGKLYGNIVIELRTEYFYLFFY